MEGSAVLGVMYGGMYGGIYSATIDLTSIDAPLAQWLRRDLPKVEILGSSPG